MCADCDVAPPATYICLRPWDDALSLSFRKAQSGYDPRLYEVRLEGKQRAWLFRWSDLSHLQNFVGDTSACKGSRRCEVVAEVNLTELWSLNNRSVVTLEFV